MAAFMVFSYAGDTQLDTSPAKGRLEWISLLRPVFGTFSFADRINKLEGWRPCWIIVAPKSSHERYFRVFLWVHQAVDVLSFYLPAIVTYGLRAAQQE